VPTSMSVLYDRTPIIESSNSEESSTGAVAACGGTLSFFTARETVGSQSTITHQKVREQIDINEVRKSNDKGIKMLNKLKNELIKQTRCSSAK
jgi:hypothetical protein